MKVEDPMLVYQVKTTSSGLRGKIMDSVERETDKRVLQRIYVFIEQLKSEKKTSRKKITVSPRIKALSDVPSTTGDFDYKNDFVAVTEDKYI